MKASDRTDPHLHQVQAMQEATDLTRQGRLAEATALIQRTLGRSGASAADGPRPGDRMPDNDGGGRLDKLKGLLKRFGRGPGEAPADPVITVHPPTGRRASTEKSPTRPAARRASQPTSPGAGRWSQPMSPGARGASQPSTPAPSAPRPAGPIADGMTRHTFSCPTGQRPYLVYVPPRLPPRRVPLVLMLHGGTQDGASFAAATGMNALADDHGFVVAYPEQLTSANPMRYWKWFSPGDQRRGAGEAAILAGIVDEVTQEHGIDRKRVLVAGFSAGAAMAAVLGEQYPDVFAAVGVHSGLASGAARDLGSALMAMRSAPPSTPAPQPVRAIIFHGDRDTTVNVGNARAVAHQFCPDPVHTSTTEDEDGRRFTREVRSGRDGRTTELWTVHGAGHVWSGGVAGGSYADPKGPDASAEMVRFLLGGRVGSTVGR